MYDLCMRMTIELLEPIEHGLTEPCVGEDLGPLGEGQVGGDDDSGLYGSLGV
jgi:hypothetical protein